MARDGKKEIVVQHWDGGGMKIPREWTDVDGPRLHVVSKPEVVATASDLRDLIRLVEALRARS